MLAMLFATEIIAGNWTFKRVPSIWENDVRELLRVEGREDLISAR